ncbi:MAG: transketolase [Ruminococcus sp.]|uniref:transketolase family protein n=1 Tax=Ruminococcus sp. TaxID=41978 RepID=UPI002872DF4B|nr:transketolase C-terminal domain-containing protein [Ruminococcus sp.]MBQ3285193.1 transketolase [Ruminococcus sp.]
MKVTSANIRMWSRLGQRGAFFGIAMPELANQIENLKLVTADLALLSGMDRFRSAHPEKFLNVGIAEQNMIGVSAGLAMDGHCVFATTYSSFIAVRSLEHVRQHLAHMQCNVKIIGSAAGVAAAKSGISHWATEDIAFTRVLPNIEVYSAADSLEAIKLAEYAASVNKPMYIRLSGGLNCPIVYNDDYEFIPGKLVELKQGENAAIIATGLMVAESLKAAELLSEQGINCSVYNMHTIKPLDKEKLNELFRNNRLIVTVEEHNVIGGMGSAVAEYKATLKESPRQLFIGVQDTYTNAGSQRYVWEQLGITAEQIADSILKEIIK